MRLVMSTGVWRNTPPTRYGSAPDSSAARKSTAGGDGCSSVPVARQSGVQMWVMLLCDAELVTMTSGCRVASAAARALPNRHVRRIHPSAKTRQEGRLLVDLGAGVHREVVSHPGLRLIA